ncbi:MAG: PadR family transcriptional regulator [Propionibacteriaceae bacterium]|jgi:DNA-binding PadR family transcriptional regulator|nr:PadR family transcriptional regulator [Propionibacteriaceae bacterium]
MTNDKGWETGFFAATTGRGECGPDHPLGRDLGGRRRGGRPDRPGWPDRPGFRGGRARRGQLRDSVLRLLADQSLNGYQLMTSLAEKTLGAWRPSPGAIYPCLAQLEDEGLIAAGDADGQKVYTLTETGQAEAAQVTAEPWAGPLGTPTERQAMMEQYRNLGLAIRFAAQTASPDQMTAIAKHLEAGRKTVLAVLAEAE